MTPDVSHLDIGERRLACRIRAGRSPTLLFLPGYASDMDGAKAVALDAFAEQRGLGLLRFDYSGTGLSGGSFEDGTLDHWLAEALEMVDRLTEGPVMVVGSSMGGWIALHLALRRPERVAALVGIAAAPDFTDWGFSDAQKAELLTAGRTEHEQLMTRDFWQSGQALRLLDSPIPILCPVRLVHGELDADVPPAIALRLLRQLGSADAQLTIVKGSGHRLSQPHEIDTIVRTLAALIDPQVQYEPGAPR